MNSRLLLFLALAAFIVAGVVFLANSNGGGEAPSLPGSSTPAPTPEPRGVSGQAGIKTQNPQRDEVVGRETIDLEPGRAGLPQGVKGLLVAPDGAPVADTSVYLTQSGLAGGDLFKVLQLQSSGIILPPVTHVRTDKQGVFAAGAHTGEIGKEFEIRIVTDRFIDKDIPNLHIKEVQWHDLGRIELQRGVSLRGQVTASQTGAPVSDAFVSLKSGSGQMIFSPVPSREEGLSVRTDSSGWYTISNAPSGIANLAAVASGYGRVEKTNMTIDTGADNQIDFQLPPGLSIAGVVTDAVGDPLSGVRIRGTGFSGKTPLAASAVSDRDGQFEILGLVEGPYTLRAVAFDRIDAEVKPVEAGQTEVHIVLEKKGGARIRVRGRNGAILKRYDLTARSYWKSDDPAEALTYGNTTYGTRPGRPDRNGISTFSGLDPGDYVFQVQAPGYAMAFSGHFSTAIGEETPLVELTLNEGGVIEGVVILDRVGPLAGVEVRTRRDGALSLTGIIAAFEALAPVMITQSVTHTDKQGRFRFKLLNEGKYQLRFSHAEAIRVIQNGVEVRTGETTNLPDVEMAAGTVVSGRVIIAGKKMGQVQAKVSLSSVAEEGSDPSLSFTAEAVTGPDGKFEISSRVPPGRYELTAARTGLPNPFSIIIDHTNSKQEFQLRGQPKFFVEVRLPVQ